MHGDCTARDSYIAMFNGSAARGGGGGDVPTLNRFPVRRGMEWESVWRR